MNRLLNDEQEKFFRENQHGLLRQDAADLMNEVFGLELTELQVKELRRRLHPDVGKVSLKGMTNGGTFKKGTRPHNYQPIGTESIKSDGYIWRKIAEPNKWKQKHILLWEEVNGPRKPGEKIIFLNGDRYDIRLENLAKVSNAVNSMLTSYNLRSKNAEVTKAGINVANLYDACNKRKKKHNGGKNGR